MYDSVLDVFMYLFRDHRDLHVLTHSVPTRRSYDLFYQRQSHNIEQNYIIDNIADAITVTGTDSNIWLTQQKRVDRDYAAFGELSFDITDKLTLTRSEEHTSELQSLMRRSYAAFSS